MIMTGCDAECLEVQSAINFKLRRTILAISCWRIRPVMSFMRDKLGKLRTLDIIDCVNVAGLASLSTCTEC